MSKSTISPQNNPYKRIIIILAIGVLIFGFGTLALLVYAMRSEIGTLLALTTPTPAMPCGQPVLTVGSTPYEIESLPPGTDGSVEVPVDTPGVAYRVESTEAGSIYVLSPTRDNLIAAAAAQAGDPIDITWADCAHESYTSNGVQQENVAFQDLPGEQDSGITIVVQMEESQALLIRGDLIASFGNEAQGQSVENGGEAEIQYVYTSVSEDGETLFMVTSILNASGDIIVLQEGDFSLTTMDNETLNPLNIEPAPPVEIRPGEEAVIHVSFPNPDGDTAVLNVQSLRENVDLTVDEDD